MAYFSTRGFNFQSSLKNSVFNQKFKISGCVQQKFSQNIATSGNRTRASRVAGENSTTEPTLPGALCGCQWNPNLKHLTCSILVMCFILANSDFTKKMTRQAFCSKRYGLCPGPSSYSRIRAIKDC